MGGKKEVITLLLFTDGDRDQITSLLSHRKPVAEQNRGNWDFLEADALTTNSLLPSLPTYFCFNSQPPATAHRKRKCLPLQLPKDR